MGAMIYDLDESGKTGWYILLSDGTYRPERFATAKEALEFAENNGWAGCK